LKVISGGQTGVDRAALDAARDLGLPYGGYVPRGRWTEEGPLPQGYGGMVETEGRHPSARTKRNVAAANATLIVARGDCEGGTLLTLRTARALGKPHLVIDLAVTSLEEAARTVRDWLEATAPETLNVAGPRASKDPEIYKEAKAILVAALQRPPA
jgi:hypothetical protein